MIKGIAALFSSGAILNPMVLIGVISGFYFAFSLPNEVVFDLYKNYHLYLLVLFIAVFYNVFFKKVYDEGGRKLDIAAMTGNVILSAIKLIFANLMTMSLVSFISF